MQWRRENQTRMTLDPMTKTTEAVRTELKQQFERFDMNQNGLIDEMEFQQLLRALGDEAPAETLSLQFAAIDGNDDGFVHFEEFADWWLN